MKLYLEEDSLNEDGEKIIIKIKEVKDKAEAIKLKKVNKSYLHVCYHDEAHPKSCRREVL